MKCPKCDSGNLKSTLWVGLTHCVDCGFTGDDKIFEERIMKKRRITIEFPVESPSWETWVDAYDFRKFCKENGIIIIEEKDVGMVEK